MPWVWPQIRQQVLFDGGYKCKYCGYSTKLHCHEVWEWSIEEGIQRLIGIELVCKWCHLAIHIGYAQFADKVDRAVNQFCKVNKCSRADALDHYQACSEYFRRFLRDRDFRVDISYIFDAFDIIDELESPL